MPCYMFTYHGKGTWLPDHPRGYVHRTYELQPSDAPMADCYRANMRSDPVAFDDQMLALLIEGACNAGKFIDAVVHGCGTDPTHIHVLVSWNHDRTFQSMRASSRSGMSRAMNHMFGKREWFSDFPSRKRVRHQKHFDYVVLEYLPKHRRSRVRQEDRMAAEKRDALRPVSVRERA
jgi:hypothetical protein